ncbi:MAG: sporulation protein YunB [Oscillospiraceae bacterium]
MRSYRHSGKAVRRINRVFIVLLAVVVLVFFIVHVQLKTHIEAICEYAGEQKAVQVISDQVEALLLRENLSYGDFVKVSKNADGAVTSIESNMLAVNLLQNEIASSINDRLSDTSHDTVKIASGTLIGANLLSGRGPDVTLKIHQTGSVEVHLHSTLTSAGINQTVHRITLTVSVEMSAVIPSYTTYVDVNTDYVLAETVIVGDVPDAYAGFDLGN